MSVSSSQTEVDKKFDAEFDEMEELMDMATEALTIVRHCHDGRLHYARLLQKTGVGV